MGYEDRQLSDEELAVRGIEIEDISALFESFFTGRGFDDVEMVELDDVPEHAMTWLGEGFDEEVLEQIIEDEDGPRYYRVSTLQGAFGMYYAGSWLVDTTGTDILIRDLVDNEEDFSFEETFFPVGEDTLLKRFIARMMLYHEYRLMDESLEWFEHDDAQDYQEDERRP